MEDFKKITNSIITKQDLVYLLDDINQAKESIYQEQQEQLSEKTKNVVSEELREIFKKQEKKNKLQTRKQQEKFLDNLKEYLQDLPQIRLTLAFSPSDSFLQEISQWLEKEIGEKTIINLTVNPEIVGGIIIEYNGRYLNLALEKKIKKATTNE